MLLAGAICSIFNIVYKTEVLTALKRLLVVLIIFYIIGLVVKSIYLAAVVKYAKKSNSNPYTASDSDINTDEATAEEQNQAAGHNQNGKQAQAKKA